MLLAKQLLKPANILVLDEPTNDLDMPTLELLEESVASFNGTLLLISHDRAFMDNVVTSTWVFSTDANGNGVVQEYVGGYQDYLVQKQRQQSAIKNQPKDQHTKDQHTKDKPNKTTAKKTAPQQAKASRKLSYKEQRELDGLPAELVSLRPSNNNYKINWQMAVGLTLTWLGQQKPVNVWHRLMSYC